MTFKKNIKRKFHLEEIIDPWNSHSVYEILLKKDAIIICDTIYALRVHFLSMDNMQKMKIFFEAFELFKEFISECKKRDLFYD